MKPLMLVTFENEDYRLGRGKGNRLLYFLNLSYSCIILTKSFKTWHRVLPKNIQFLKPRNLEKDRLQMGNYCIKQTIIEAETKNYESNDKTDYF